MRVLLRAISGLVNRHQADAIANLVEENGVLSEQLRGRRLRLTEDHRRRLAIKAKHLGRQALNRLATIGKSEQGAGEIVCNECLGGHLKS